MEHDTEIMLLNGTLDDKSKPAIFSGVYQE